MSIPDVLDYVIPVAYVVFAVLNAWFLYYIEQLKEHGCQCAIGWRRTVMQASLTVFVFSAAISLLGLSMGWNHNNTLLSVILSVVLLSVSVTYIVITRQFIEHIEEIKCTCAQTRAYDVLHWFNWFQIFTFSALIGIIILIIVASLLMTLYFSINKPIDVVKPRKSIR